jgi:hypothetical protein|tara:strand:+ start:577 stop:819 length:243 start_codon:yes stop_codon:yes gene_type:complete
METSLRFDSGKKHLKLFAKEKFSNDDNYVLTVRRRDRPHGDGPYPTAGALYPRSPSTVSRCDPCLDAFAPNPALRRRSSR